MKKPDWHQIFDQKNRFVELMAMSQTMQELRELISKGQARYYSWKKFRYQKMPKGIKSEEAWSLLMMQRVASGEMLPIRANNRQFFRLGLTKEHYRLLRTIDSRASGTLASPVEFPDGRERERLIISGLIEESIRSSQLEGASTLRDVAKEMIKSERSPKNESERMILNNYIAMKHIEQWPDRELSDEFLKEVHQIITKDLLPIDKSGEYRKDSDKITVSDSVTGEIHHQPKKVTEMKEDMKHLFRFFNEDDEYIHPIIKGIILHFWICYLHPFVDGNGRTARVLFYWYTIKKGYWPFKYIPLSNTIQKSKTSYGQAYRDAEQIDELDLGYFVHYLLRVINLSIDGFESYLQRKQAKAQKMRSLWKRVGDFNTRQMSIIETLEKNGNMSIDILRHQKNFNLSYEAARRDFLLLVEKKILMREKRGKKFVYTLSGNIKLPKV